MPHTQRNHPSDGSIFFEETERQSDQEDFPMNPASIRPSSHGRAAAVLLTIFAVALALLAPAARPVSAGILPATIIVTTTTINDDANDGQCSLYEAISAS